MSRRITANRKKLSEQLFNIFAQIFIPLIVAIIVGAFSYIATIKSISSSNRNNLDIANRNSKTLLETVELTNKNNQEIAEKNNRTLLESVEKSNRVSREVSERNYQRDLSKLKAEFNLREDEKIKKEKDEINKSINLLCSDIYSRLDLLKTSYNLFRCVRNGYLSQKYFNDIDQLRRFVIQTRVDSLINQIHLTVQNINNDSLISQINKLPAEVSIPALKFYRTIDLINKSTEQKVYKDESLFYEEYLNHPYNKWDFLFASDDVKISTLHVDLLHQNMKIIPIIYHINSAYQNGIEALIQVNKLKGLGYEELENGLKEISKYDSEDFSIYPKSFISDVEKLRNSN
jgi:hypothetical protein